MDQVPLDGKKTGETTLLAFDFSSRLAVGETLSSASTTAVVWTGTDPSPSSVIASSATLVGKQVRQRVTAGVGGVIYTLVCTAITSAGNTLQLWGFLAIV